MTEIFRKRSGTVSSSIIIYNWLMGASIWPAVIIDTSLIAAVTIFVITILFSWHYCGAFQFFRRWIIIVV